MAKNFKDLTEQEILALAISLEEDDGRIYADFAEGLRQDYPATAKILDEMRAEESEHRNNLIQMYRQRFGDHIPLIRRTEVKGFIKRRPIWLLRPLSVEQVRKQVEIMELETRRFYERAGEKVADASTRALLDNLAETERKHSAMAESLAEQHLTPDSRTAEAAAERRKFLLQVVQPGLLGLMDGSVSTLAPLFAAAFLTRTSSDALLVGLAASIGAGISMGFAEALSDDGSLTGRGLPLARGVICGLMTMAGGLGHTLPFLIANFHLALTLAVIVVVVELSAMSYIRHRYMDTPLVSAALQVMLGGALVFLSGILIGRA